MFNAAMRDPSVRIVVVSELNTWRGSLFSNHADSLEDLFYQRVQRHEDFEYSAIENSLLALKECGKAEVQLALVGKLFGGKGYDHQNLLM